LSLQTNRTLGGIGACLTLVGAVSGVSSLIRYFYPNSVASNMIFSAISGIFGVFAFVGFLLFLIAMYGFSKAYGEHRIFSYILWGIISTIVAAAIAVVIYLVIIFLNIASLIPNLNASTNSPTQITSLMLTYLAPFFAIVGAISLINVVFNVKAFNLLADKSNVPLFRTATIVLLAGALLSLAIGIAFAALASSGSVSLNTLLVVAIPGGLVQDIAWVLFAISFFRIKVPPTQTFTQSTVSSAVGQVKYCPNCGTANQPDAAYCIRCGQKL